VQLAIWVWQLVPPQPAGQEQEYAPELSSHVPPCWHESLPQQLAAVLASAQVVPLQQPLQAQVATPPTTSQAPPFWHGFGEQLAGMGVAQSAPVQPCAQVHTTRPFGSLAHVPPFKQVEGSQVVECT
jgi:hypothetical protein